MPIGALPHGSVESLPVPHRVLVAPEQRAAVPAAISAIRAIFEMTPLIGHTPMPDDRIKKLQAQTRAKIAARRWCGLKRARDNTDEGKNDPIH